MGNQEVTGDELENMKIQATMNAELYFKEMGLKAELKGLEDVEGKPAWKIQMTFPSGRTSVDFYDQESGLKVKSVNEQSGVTAIALYSDYRNVDGILFPYNTKQTAGPQSLDIVVKSVEINKGIDDSVFN